MFTTQTKPKTNTRAEDHKKAAECCDKAAFEHREAAKNCTAGDHKSAAEHAKHALDHGTEALGHGRHAVAV